MHDVIVIGGSYAGMSAALQLGRGRRDVLVIDAGQRRNRFASHSHGLLGHDGAPPEVIAAEGRAEVLAYPTVAWRDGEVDEVNAVAGGFRVRVGGDEHHARRIVLATGVVDQLPEVPGLAQRWGRSVFHCPYCHGYELDEGRIGVLATSPLALHSVALVSEWSEPGGATLFLDGAFEPDADQLAELAHREIRVERARVTALEGDSPELRVRLADERTVSLAGLFVVPRTRIAGPFAEQLGCELAEGPSGFFYRTDAAKQTSVPGVFACGDTAAAFGTVAIAIGDGVLAGTSAHKSLVFAGLPRRRA
ncbi:MAG TPA: NAD(P)/FAD-dependent oxidoreductase [Nannocystaceae bacterium]|nr:NAD(P)/FAD-dependent oxidoreductase [Nannocystaceae bacterium]